MNVTAATFSTPSWQDHEHRRPTAPARKPRTNRAPSSAGGEGPSGCLQRLEERTLFAASPAFVELQAAQVDAEAAVLSDIYVFGDSLSDVGDLVEMVGGLAPLPPHDAEGRFSNGPLWVEQLADSLGLDLTDENNFAIGGAKSGHDNLADQPGIIEFPGMLDRIAEYAAAVGQGGADPDALYVVWAGANDFLGLTTFDPATVQATLINAVNNIVTAVATLDALGAEHILVPNLPDLGLVPLGIATGIPQQLTQVSLAFNAALEGALDQLALADIDTIPVDIFTWHNAVNADPAAFGITEPITPLLLAGPATDPDDYLFFDDQHPTTAGHGLIADVARDAIYESGLLPSLSFSAGQSVRYTDATGDRVTVRVTGPGSGEVRLLGGRSDAAHIVLDGTTAASTLNISVVGGKKGGTTVFDIDVDGSLGRIIAPNADLIGDVVVAGFLGMMHVDDFVGAAPQTIELRGPSPRPRSTFKLIADKPCEVEIETESRVSTIDVGGRGSAFSRLAGPSFLRDLRSLISFIRR